MLKVALLFFFITYIDLGRATEDPIASSSNKPTTGTTLGGSITDLSTPKPPDFSRHRAVSALLYPPVVFSPQPYVMNSMNPKSQDLQASSSVDYAYGHPGDSNGYEYYSPSPVYDHHLLHGNEHAYQMEEDSHHLENRQVGATARDIALGFLTFLIVLSTLQGATLNLMRNANIVSIMPAGRRRREVQEQPPLKQMTEKTPLIKIPEVNSLLKEDNRVRYVQQNICITASSIARLFGLSGSTFAHYISESVFKSDSNGWTRLVADAGSAGIAGDDCRSLYRHNDAYIMDKYGL